LATLRQQCSVGIAVDGPKGPFGEVHEGVIQLSRRSQCPIVPLIVEPDRCWKLRNWDRTVVPRPFSQVTVREAEPLLVPADADAEAVLLWRRKLSDTLLQQSRAGDRGVSADAAAPQGGAA
jgi:lysophospholipid acyltransferase (LPLAT)-like uncharacterized protein